MPSSRQEPLNSVASVILALAAVVAVTQSSCPQSRVTMSVTCRDADTLVELRRSYEDLAFVMAVCSHLTPAEASSLAACSTRPNLASRGYDLTCDEENEILLKWLHVNMQPAELACDDNPFCEDWLEYHAREYFMPH